jgi:hypothetical protein
MSLIHDALRSVDATAVAPVAMAPAASLPPASASPMARRSFEWLGGVAAFALVVAAGGVSWKLWLHSTTSGAPAAVPVPQPVPVLPAVSAAPIASVVPQVPVAPPASGQESGEGVKATEPPAHPDGVAPLQTQKFEKNNKKVALPLAEKGKLAVKKVDKQEAKQTPPAEDTQPIAQRFAQFMAAMNVSDMAGAQAELDALSKRLPPEALGLVRAQAWFDLKANHPDAAMKGYRSVLDRLPGDEEAAINLASLLSHAGHAEAARAVLAQAAQINPDSVPLRNALRRFNPDARP